MAGLLDYLFDPSTYGDPNGGLLSRLSAMQGNFSGAGFPDQGNQSSPLDSAQWPYGPRGAPSSAPAASFAERFNALPGAPQPVTPSGRNFDETFAQVPNAPNQAQPIAVGDYQMPRIGNASLFAGDPGSLPMNARPAVGQMQPGQAMPSQPAPMQQPQTMQQGLPAALSGGQPGFMTAYQNMKGGGGLIGSIAAGISGQRNDPSGIAQQNLQAQYLAMRQAFIQNGLSPQEASSRAMMAALNPEAAKTILPEALSGREKFQKVGQDPLTGVEQYGFVNERDRTINGKPLNAQPANSTNALGDPNLTGDAYLQSLPESIRSQVKAIVEGRMQPPSGFALKSPQIQALMRAAAQYEPGFDLTKWSARTATNKDFASGAAAKNVTSLNTVIGHLSDLKEKAEALGNYNSGFGPLTTTVNQYGNAYNSASGRPEVNNFNLARNAVADELSKVFKGSGISDHEIAQWKSTLNESMTPDQLKGAVKTAIGLMESRLYALNDQRDRGMNTSSQPRDLLTDKSKAALAKIEQWASGETAGKPVGGIQEGATATNPQTGQKLTFRNGKWQ